MCILRVRAHVKTSKARPPKLLKVKKAIRTRAGMYRFVFTGEGIEPTCHLRASTRRGRTFEVLQIGSIIAQLLILRLRIKLFGSDSTKTGILWYNDDNNHYFAINRIITKRAPDW